MRCAMHIYADSSNALLKLETFISTSKYKYIYMYKGIIAGIVISVNSTIKTRQYGDLVVKLNIKPSISLLKH